MSGLKDGVQISSDFSNTSGNIVEIRTVSDMWKKGLCQMVLQILALDFIPDIYLYRSRLKELLDI